jgi:rhodanese-related sulfurtransferase
MKKAIIKLFVIGLICFLPSNTFCNDTLTCQEAKVVFDNDKNDTIKIIDVRTPDEFAENHLLSAININYFDKNFDQKLEKLNKKSTYIIYCKKGGRSALSLAKMHSIGFQHVKHIKGGIEEWKSLGYKLE